MIQRGFKDLKISEQAFAVAIRYKKLFDEKKLAAIDEELRSLQSSKGVYPLEPPPKGNTRDIIAENYGVGHPTVSRLIRINELSDEFK